MGRTIPSRVLPLVVAALPLTGCFRYVPATLETVPVGQDVRLFVTQQGLSEASAVSPGDQPIVRGTLVSRDATQLFIRVPTAVRQEGFHTAVLGQDVSIPIREIVQVERRQIDPLGTGLLVAGTAAVAGTVIFVIMEAVAGDNGDPGDGVEESRVPLFSIPLR